MQCRHQIPLLRAHGTLQKRMWKECKSVMLSHHHGNGNKYRDTRLDNVPRARGLGTLIPKWNVSIKSFPAGFMEP